jgi:pimeloyl-ACP methyl ester carboxylesterase
MRNLFVVLLILICASATSSAQISEDIYLDEYVNGTLTIPEDFSTRQVALIIQGSGPTDRNGNNPSMENNSLKMLADSLAASGIASLRYDKRGIANSYVPDLKESEMSIDLFIADAKGWVEMLHNDPRFDDITVIGHSQGSLVGMMASHTYVDRFISIAGAGYPMDSIVIRQLQQRAPLLVDESKEILSQLRQGMPVDSLNPFLMNLFRPSVQPFLMSYIEKSPTTEIAKLNIPILIINGDMDIQTTVDDAQQLYAAADQASLFIIDNMNHILKYVDYEATQFANMMTYNKPGLPLMSDLVNSILEFLKTK